MKSLAISKGSVTFISTTTNELGTKWAPSSTYGEEVGKLYINLIIQSLRDNKKE